MIKDERIIRAIWCADSETYEQTGEEMLIDLDTHEVIMKRVRGVMVDPKPAVKEEPKQPEAL